MAQIAIKGHATRGEEVIEILEMLGGKDINDHRGDNEKCIFFVINGRISYEYYFINDFINDDFIIFTLEEFLEKFPYKVGDKVKAWINGYCGIHTINEMRWDSTSNEIKYRIGDYWYSTSILQPYKEQENMEERESSVVVNNEHKQLKIHSLRYDKVQLMIDDKYELKQEGDAFYIVKKQPQYPKTYKECCEVLEILDNWHLTLELDRDAPCDLDVSKEHDYVAKLDVLRKLFICHNAYWKIAGEQMGLDKPWKPDWSDEYALLSFPTEEMRDAFYENFKELIEKCKELL